MLITEFFNFIFLYEKQLIMTTAKKLYYYAFALLGATLLLFSSCKKENDKNIPVLSTTEVTGITQTTAMSGGNITDDRGSTVTARGVCRSTSQNPTIRDSKTEDGTGIGSFTSSISGLEPNTTYYVRAYATNSAGTGYGSTMSFTTLRGAVDADGNVYHSVIIGGQEWFAENLRTTRYNDGTPIPNVTNDSDWRSLSTGAYCWHDNNPANGKTYGALYNWHAVNTGKLCPTGWHVPSDAEWTALTDYVGNDAAIKLKSTSGWNAGGNGTDDYGFSALPGGYRYGYAGSFVSVGSSGYWWSSTVNHSANIWNRNMDYDYGNVNRYDLDKKYGFSVRCVRD